MVLGDFDATIPLETFAAVRDLRLSDAVKDSPLTAAISQVGVNGRSLGESRASFLDHGGQAANDFGQATAEAAQAMGDAAGAPPRPRKLSDDELTLLSGGDYSVAVDGPGWDWNFPSNDPGEQYPGGSGGGSEPTSYVQELENQCEADNKVDFAAQQLANLIKTMPDWNEREYAAIIYMTTDGQIRTTDLFKGQTVAEALALGQVAPETKLSAPADLGDGVILAVIHSHPDLGYDSAEEDHDNWYPSDRPDSGDYYSFEQLVGRDPRFANNVAFAQYILGPDGLLREFNAKDGRITRLNDPDPGSRTNLAKDRPCSQ